MGWRVRGGGLRSGGGGGTEVRSQRAEVRGGRRRAEDGRRSVLQAAGGRRAWHGRRRSRRRWNVDRGRRGRGSRWWVDGSRLRNDAGRGTVDGGGWRAPERGRRTPCPSGRRAFRRWSRRGSGRGHRRDGARLPHWGRDGRGCHRGRRNRFAIVDCRFWIGGGAGMGWRRHGRRRWTMDRGRSRGLPQSVGRTDHAAGGQAGFIQKGRFDGPVAQGEV